MSTKENFFENYNRTASCSVLTPKLSTRNRLPIEKANKLAFYLRSQQKTQCFGSSVLEVLVMDLEF